MLHKSTCLAVSVGLAVLFSQPSTAVAQAGPNLVIAMSHTGNFTVGENGVYTIVVSNIGGTASSGPIAVSDTLSGNFPVGYPLEDIPQFGFVSATGTGWSCSLVGLGGIPFDAFYVGCTSSSVIVAGGFAPPITLTVLPTVSGTVTNQADVGATPCGPSNTGVCSFVAIANDPTIVVAAVPTLPEWAMIVLTALLALACFAAIRLRTT
jgi:uncharacterized repeat protein (TIGR01451 family)